MKYFWAKYQQEMGIVKDEPESIDNINTSEKLSCDTSEEIYSCAQPPVSSPIRKFGKNIRCNPDGKLAPTIKRLTQSINRNFVTL